MDIIFTNPAFTRTPGEKMTADCMGMTKVGFDKETGVRERDLFQKMKQLTNISREGEKLVITTGGEKLVMERDAREVVTAVPCMGNEEC